jgi:hypothetical protein
MVDDIHRRRLHLRKRHLWWRNWREYAHRRALFKGLEVVALT